jgi:hypothetical protein
MATLDQDYDIAVVLDDNDGTIFSKINAAFENDFYRCSRASDSQKYK